MKLVDRKTFLSLPKGTVFCKFPLNDEGDAHRMTFGMGSPCIKGETIGDDFFSCILGEDMQPVNANDSEELFDTFFDMQKNLAKVVPFELVGGRDGFFDDENVGFMIYSREEIQEMIDELNHCLRLLSSSALEQEQ